MKTSYALPFTVLFGLGIAGVVAFAGCSSSSAPVDNTPVDSGVADTGKPDTWDGYVPPAPTCAVDLASDFACAPPAAVTTAKNSCTENNIQDFATACGSSGTQTTCSAWQKANAGCNTCVLKFIEDSGALKTALCFKELDTTGTCGTSVECYNACISDVCGSCDPTEGSGSTATRSELDDCVRDAAFAGNAGKPKGRCYDVAAKAYKVCAADGRFANCGDLVTFFRGACRDGVDWSHSDDPTWNAVPTDAGADAVSDAPTDAPADALADAPADVAADAADAVADGG